MKIFIAMFSGISGLIGIIFFIIGIVILKKRKTKEKNCTSKTYGKVVDILKHKNVDLNGGHTYSWHPVFEYTIENLKYIKESLYGSSSSKFAIGQNVEIHFNPQNYNEFYIAEETLPRTLGTIFTIVGIVLIVIAIFIPIILLIYHGKAFIDS